MTEGTKSHGEPVSEIETGGSAFPLPASETNQGHHGPVRGMTLRDYFAAKAMRGVMAEERGAVAERIAAWSYEVADAMLAARDKA